MVDPQDGDSIGGPRSVRDEHISPKSIDAENINEVVQVSSADELQAAIGIHPEIAISQDFIWDKGYLELDAGATDVKIYGRGKTITRGDNQNTRLVEIITTGQVEIHNLNIDGNRQNQRKADKEIEVRNASTFLSTNTTIVNNGNFALTGYNCNNVQIVNYECESNAQGLKSEARGLDGLHFFDCENITISNPNINTGDDCIAVAARDKSINNISVNGGVLRSGDGDSGSGVKVFVHSGANQETAVTNVAIEGLTIGEVNDRYVTLQDESSNNGFFENVTVDISASEAVRQGGIRLDKAQNVTISGSVKAQHGLRCEQCSDLTISATIDAEDHGIELVDCIGVTFDGIVYGAKSYGIFGEETTDAYLNGIVHSCGTGVETINNSDEFHGELHMFENSTDFSLVGNNNTLSKS